MNVGDAIPTIEDWKLLMTSKYISLDASTQNLFDRAIHLFATNNNPQNHNKHCLRYLDHPIAPNVTIWVRRNYSIEENEEELEL
jgi:hypothetical protein